MAESVGLGHRLVKPVDPCNVAQLTRTDVKLEVETRDGWWCGIESRPPLEPPLLVHVETQEMGDNEVERNDRSITQRLTYKSVLQLPHFLVFLLVRPCHKSQPWEMHPHVDRRRLLKLDGLDHDLFG